MKLFIVWEHSVMHVMISVCVVFCVLLQVPRVKKNTCVLSNSDKQLDTIQIDCDVTLLLPQ